MTWNRENPTPASPTSARHAPRLRKAMTPAEKRLWRALRHEVALPAGCHFRRQFAIGSHIVDFVCLRARLIIEVDGPIHLDAGNRQRDAIRDVFLADENFTVLRFANHAVETAIGPVIARIEAALVASTPTPGPSPQGGGEQGAHP